MGSRMIDWAPNGRLLAKLDRLFPPSPPTQTQLNQTKQVVLFPGLEAAPSPKLSALTLVSDQLVVSSSRLLASNYAPFAPFN